MLIIVKTEGYVTIFMISKITKNNESKEIDIKSHTCYYFNGTLIMTSILVIFYLTKKYIKIFCFIKLHMKPICYKTIKYYRDGLIRKYHRTKYFA